MFCFTVPFSKSRLFCQALRTIEFDLQDVHVFRDDLHAWLIVTLHFRPWFDWDHCKESFRLFRDSLGFDLDDVHSSDIDSES